MNIDPRAAARRFEERQQAVAELRSLDTHTEGRALTAEERQTEARLNAVIAEADAVLADYHRRQAAESAASEARAFFDAPATNTAAAAEAASLRSMLLGHGERRFDVRLPEQRDLLKSGNGGAAASRVSLASALNEHLVELSAIRQADPELFTTDTGEDLKVVTSSAQSTAAIVAEAGTFTESDPTIGSVTLSAFKYGFMLQASHEMVEDQAVDLVGYIARQAAEAITNASGAHYLTGTGTGQPQGLFPNVTAGRTVAVAGTITTDDFLELFYSVGSRYRRDASWLMADGTAAAVRRLKDSTGQYLWQPGLTLGQPDLLLGRPVFTDPFCPALNATAAQRYVAFGSFRKAYAIRDVRGVRFDVSPDFAFDKDLVTYRVSFRTDGRVLRSDAVKALRNP